MDAAVQASHLWSTGQAKRPNQQARILAMLATGNPVCGAALLEARMPRYSARIQDLRAAGWQITTTSCTHGMAVAHYTLEPL